MKFLILNFCIIRGFDVIHFATKQPGKITLNTRPGGNSGYFSPWTMDDLGTMVGMCNIPNKSQCKILGAH